MKAWGRVPEGHMAVLTNYDKVKRDKQGHPNPIIKEPGLRFKSPYRGSLVPVDCRMRSNTLEGEPLERDKQLWKVKAAVFWKISADGFNPYRASYHAKSEEELTQIVTNTCLNGLRVVMEKVEEDIMHDEQAVYLRTFNRTYEELLYYGVEFTRLKLLSVAIEPIEVLKSAILQEGMTSAAVGALAAQAELGLDSIV